ncbi:thioredoxin-disulfide reductase [Leptospira interrogans]|uniref:Thioredoxin reductase n=11 Tax=Leptospira interrogans TaxID=173 RepID=Q8F3B3_LEPIN|nr:MULTISPECIES: thioredoxin-disulfide reductase [Leptospira]EMF41600.1 thioredoxin-disulfide reductase [Leptospira interrogans serovar Lora str. TE 1992]EMG08654.1 thioredoxin-disulfide reductase [Leptospira interrogans serovar Grippotyphosa str. LT2186]EMM84548.1 thioredoxin-disulfide reductase [Leptospira interrogans str. 2006001854]EMN73169.1 thioredoxin-disulfide reductase [Leptospira interrogans serovar Bataviae str. UI 08561]AAN49693.1 thioredoxin reductase [Leptospira interrogans serov
MAHKIVIIGSGPAGHTAAIYAARANLNPVMYEGFMAGGIAAGGQLTTTTEVENFPGFPEGIDGTKLTQLFREQSIKYGTKIITQTITKVDFSSKPFKLWSDDELIEAQAVIIATGATAKRMNVIGEDIYWQRGISACAVCDGALPIYRNKELVVVGGGDSAVEEASHLTKFASKVYLVHRRDSLRASKIMQKRATTHPKIEIIWNSQVKEAKGDGKSLTSLTLENTTNGQKKELPVGGLFYAIGHKPNTDIFQGILDLDESGYIKTVPGSTKTNIEGIFAAGDVQDKIYRQAVSAAGSGCMAALDAERWLESREEE